MNWGYKITIVIAVFIIIMTSMVYVAFKQSNEMMDKSYYQKELKYQTYIDASKNLNSISVDTLITQDEQNILVQIPTDLVSNFEKGSIEFLRGDDQNKDLTVPFTPDAKGIFLIGKSKFSKGNYTARIQWNCGDKPFYREQTLIIM